MVERKVLDVAGDDAIELRPGNRSCRLTALSTYRLAQTETAFGLCCRIAAAAPTSNNDVVPDGINAKTSCLTSPKYDSLFSA